MDFKACWDYQEVLFNSVIEQKVKNRILSDSEKKPTKNHLLFVEHPHVYTLGKSGDEKNLLVDTQQLAEKKADYYRINRGGDMTYHGPGQLVAYPILDLDNFFTDIHRYLRLLEETIILTLVEYSVKAGRAKGETGVWLFDENPEKEKSNPRKICAMGVRCSRWVTMHGWGFNVNADLNYFKHIIPCGIADKSVTSMHQELGQKVNMNEVKERLKINFAKLFEATLISK